MRKAEYPARSVAAWCADVWQRSTVLRVDVVGVVGTARHVVRRHQHLVKVLPRSAGVSAASHDVACRSRGAPGGRVGERVGASVSSR